MKSYQKLLLTGLLCLAVSTFWGWLSFKDAPDIVWEYVFNCVSMASFGNAMIKKSLDV